MVSLASACGPFDATSNSGQPTLSLTAEELAVGEAVQVTLKVPCGVGPIVVGGEVFETHTYAAPSQGLVDEWGPAKTGRLRRTHDDTLSFVPDNSTIRLQFKRTTRVEHAPPWLLTEQCP